MMSKLKVLSLSWFDIFSQLNQQHKHDLIKTKKIIIKRTYRHFIGDLTKIG
jgi:hypothetical protein